MEEGFSFPSQLWVLLNSEDVPVNLIFMTDFGAWVRENGEWIEFIIDDADPKRQFEDMQIAPVDPRIIDAWDLGGFAEADLDEYEYKWSPPVMPSTDEDTKAVVADAYGFVDSSAGLASALRRLVSDSMTAYHHAQGYHWNVRGQDFTQYHTLFQEIYTDYLGSIDPTAENLLKIGEAAPYTHQELEMFRSIPDVPAAETPKDMATSLLAINDALRNSTKAAFDEAANVDDQGMLNFLGERLDILDKWSWQLRASIA